MPRADHARERHGRSPEAGVLQELMGRPVSAEDVDRFLEGREPLASDR